MYSARAQEGVGTYSAVWHNRQKIKGLTFIVPKQVTYSADTIDVGNNEGQAWRGIHSAKIKGKNEGVEITYSAVLVQKVQISVAVITLTHKVTMNM